MYYTYILYSPTFNKFYIGQTAHLVRRLEQHNTQDKNSFTAKYRPWVLATSFHVDSRSIAMKIEKYLKKKNRAFIVKVINEQSLRSYIISKYNSHT